MRNAERRNDALHSEFRIPHSAFNPFIPRWVYYCLPAFLTECGLMAVWLAEPLFAISRYHASPLALGVMGMANAGGYALLVIAAGWLSDRTGRRRWMLLGTLSQIVIASILPYCPTIGPFIALAALHSTLLAFFWPCYMSLISETTPPGEISGALSRFNMSWCLGAFFGSLISGRLYDHVGDRAPFVFCAVLVSISLLIQVLGRPNAKVTPEEHPLSDRPRAAVLIRQAWLTLVGNFFVVSLLMYLFPKLAELPRFGLGATGITTLHGFRMGAMLATFALMGLTTRWHFRQWPVYLCFGLMLAMLVLTALAHASWHLAVAFLAFGVTTGIAYGLSAYYSMLTPEGKGAVVGIHEMFLSSGSTLGPIFGGLVMRAWGRPEAPFWVGLAPLALLWFLSARLARRLTVRRRTGIRTS